MRTQEAQTEACASLEPGSRDRNWDPDLLCSFRLSNRECDDRSGGSLVKGLVGRHKDETSTGSIGFSRAREGVIYQCRGLVDGYLRKSNQRVSLPPPACPSVSASLSFSGSSRRQCSLPSISRAEQLDKWLSLLSWE